MANEKNISLDNLKTFKKKADATYAKKTDITASVLYVGKADEKSNSATTNGNTYLKLFENDIKRSQHLINGGGATMVSSDASGTITVSTPIKNLDTTSGSGLGNGRSENIAGSGTIYLHKVAKTGKLTDLSDRTFSNILSRGEEYLEWGGPSQMGGLSPLGVALSEAHSINQVAFINEKALTFEYSSDGGVNWTPYPSSIGNKSVFCTMTNGISLPIGRPNSNTDIIANKSKTRVTITALDGQNSYLFAKIKKMLIYVSTASAISLLVETRTGTNYNKNGAWDTVGTYSLGGWSGWNDIPLQITLGGYVGQTTNNYQLRLTASCPEISSLSSKEGKLLSLKLFGDTCWIPANSFGTEGKIYAFDINKNVTFPSFVSASSFFEGGKKLSERYLGISAKAADSSKLDGHSSSYYLDTDTEQFITGKKNFETDLNFGKWISPIRKVSDAPANLHLMNSSQTTAGFFDTVIFAGAGDWLYLGHLKPTFSIKASFRGTGDENDTYSASLGYTHGTLNTLTDWDYQGGWCVRPTKVSATTPAIIQIKFTNMLYTDVLRLILTGHNLNDSSGNYSGFLDNYTIEVCTDYAKDTWTTVVNRTNASDNIGKGLIYALQTGSYTTCYGIRLKITKCHVNGQGYAFIKITSMQLRDYRPGIKFPDCLGAISQGGGDVWGELYTKSDLVTHNVLPYATNQSYVGTANSQYWGVYSHDFYENGTALSDKYLAKGYLERLSRKLFRHTIKIECYSERTTGTALVCMLQVDSSFDRKVNSFEGLATVLGSINKETGEPGIQSSCMVSGGIVVGSGKTDYILPLIRLETDGTVNHTVFVSLKNEYPDLSEDVDSRYGSLSDYSIVTYTDSVTPVP